MIRLVATALLACTCVVLHAQSDDHSQEFTRSILKTKTGVMVVYNSDVRGFSIRVRADSIRALDQSDFMELDGTLFQASLIPVPSSQPIDTLTLEQQRAVLKAYVPYELKYFADNHITCVNVKTVYLMLGGHLFIRWSFDVAPDKTLKQYARGQVYYSAVAFDQILDLNTPLLKHTDTFASCNALLVKVARSLALSGTPIDLDRKYSELNQ
jgi:hypothetical protein